ncbi:MAG: fructose-6-phosphate aldolase [Thermoplasmata archaeon]|nr:fructose-6-phosphate aldolase [Thermoplasmata archaeon]
MRIFLDTANVDEIREANSWGVIDGVTTNPTLIAREGRDLRQVIREICAIVDGPVSAEVVSETADEMVPEARDLTKVHKNVVIKVPMTAEGLKAVSVLSDAGVQTNVTLVFSPSQALLAAKAGATYVSPFVGRLDDNSHIGMDLVRDIATIYANYGYPTQIIVASVRSPNHVVEAALAGADVATVPYGVLLKMTGHPLTDIGIEQFLEDWRKVVRQ